MIESVYYQAPEIPAVIEEAVCQSNLAFNWSLEASRADLMNPLTRLLVLQGAGQVYAYCGWHQVVDEATINYFWVAPACRRQGLGRQLLAAALKEMTHDAIKAVYLEVRASNQAALGLYDQLGFLPIGRRPQYYHAPSEDGILLQYQVEEGEK